MKKPDATIREYVRKLSEDELQFLVSAVSLKLGGDIGIVAEMLQKDVFMDKMLLSAENATEWFNLLDRVGELGLSELNYRYKK